MADELPNLSDLFFPIIGPDGERRGLIARDVAEAVASTGPLPTQAVLDQLLAGVTRVRFLGQRTEGHYRYTDVSLIDISDPSDIAALRDSLRIIDGDGGHLLTSWTHVLEVNIGDSMVAKIGIIHGSILRWAAAWRSDANLRDPIPFLDWLADHDVPTLRAEHWFRVVEQAQDG